MNVNHIVIKTEMMGTVFCFIIDIGSRKDMCKAVFEPY